LDDGVELALLGYKGVEFWRPGVTTGSHRKITNPQANDWTIRGFDIKGDLMALAGGYSSSRADLQIWSLSGSNQVQTIHRPNDYYFLSVAFLAQANQVWTTDNNWKGQIIDVEEGFSVRKIDLGSYCAFSQVDPTDPNLVLVGDAKEKVRVFDLRTEANDPSLVFAPGLGSFGPCSIVRKDTNPNDIFFGTTSGVKQYDVRKATPVAENKARCNSIAVHHQFMAAGTSSGLEFYDLTKGLATKVHDLTYTNFYPKFISMNNTALFVVHYGSHAFAVTFEK